MISREFDFHAPQELAGVFELLGRYGEEARLLAGGMSLVPMMTLGLVQPAAIISLNHVAGLDYVAEDQDAIRIGPMTRHRTVATHALIGRWCPVLAQAAGQIGDVQVRNRGTIGGSLCHADPAANYLPVMAAVGARFVLRSAGASREVEVRDFFIGLMETAARRDELIAEVVIPKLGEAGFSYQRLNRVESGFPIVNAAAIVERTGARGRLALGGAGPRPVVIELAPYLSRGFAESDIRAIGDAAYAAAADASEDINASAEYRREMARVLAQRAVRVAAAGLRSPSE